MKTKLASFALLIPVVVLAETPHIASQTTHSISSPAIALSNAKQQAKDLASKSSAIGVAIDVSMSSSNWW